MRIAQVAPLAEAVPPKLYGGTERVVYWLTEELVRQGHDVTLFASADSKTSATLTPGAPRSLRLAGINDHTASTLVMLDQIHREAEQFDIIHFHIDLFQYPLFRDISGKCLTTLHGRLDLEDAHPVYQAFPEMPLVSISQSQRVPMPAQVRWLANIHHGLPADLHQFAAQSSGYLAFIGRIAPEKRPDRAIEIATRTNTALKIAAKVDAVDQEYFKTVIKPMLDNPLIEFIGEIGERDKSEFLGGALALLFPIDWPEPFGLVMIESMATGTPVIAWKAGSTPEVIEDNLTGILVDSVEEAAFAVEAVKAIERTGVRARFLERFTADRMANDYVAAYRKLLSSSHCRNEDLISLPNAVTISPARPAAISKPGMLHVAP